MVLLTAAAVTAGAYGVYRGGQAAVKKATDTAKEIGRERKRSDQKKDLKAKSNDRKERLANLEKRRSDFQNTRTVS
jgi:hypothetical protein